MTLSLDHEKLQSIVFMLVELIRSNSPDRLYEEAADYRIGKED